MELKFIDEKDLTGTNKLNIFDTIGIDATPTDFAYYESMLLSSQRQSDFGQNRYIVLGNNFFSDNSTGSINYVENNEVVSNNMYNTDTMYFCQKNANAGIRPKVRYSYIKDIITDVYIDENGIKRGKCFNYMNSLADNETKQEILKYFQSLDRTNNEYIIFKNVNRPYSSKHYSFYYKDKQYLIVDDPQNHDDFLVFNIEPCDLLIDEVNDVAIFENIISYGLKGLDLDYSLKNFSNIAMYYKYIELLTKELLYENKSQETPINEIEFNLTEEQIMQLLEEGKLTLIQENCPRIKLNVDKEKVYIKK